MRYKGLYIGREDAMGYSEALEQQLSLGRWLHSSEGRELFSVAFGFGSEVYETGEEVREKQVREGLEILDGILEYGETYFVSSQIAEAIYMASKDFPDWQFTENSLPSNNGFVLFEHQIRNGELAVISGGIVGFMWGYLRDIVSGARSIRIHLLSPSKKSTTPIPLLVLDWQLGETVLEVSERQRKQYIGGYEELVKAGLADSFVGADKVSTAALTGGSIARLFATWLAFVRQELIVFESMVTDRSTRRRYEKDKRTEAPLVRVVLLRKKHYEHETVKSNLEKEYSCQWVVRGHWRQQWYPSLQRHQPKWITPYVKGPDDKPLKPPRATVFAVVR